MASATQDRLYEFFIAISGERDAGRDTTIDATEQLARSVSETGKVIQTAATAITKVESTNRPEGTGTEKVPMVAPLEEVRNAVLTPAANTIANGGTSSLESTLSSVMSSVLGGTPLAATTQTAAGGGGLGSTVESIASTVLKSGFGILPLVGGLLGLFGGGKSEEPPPLVKYSMPASLTFQGATTSAGIVNVDYDQNGAPRSYGDGGGGTGGRANAAAWSAPAWGTADSYGQAPDRAAPAGSATPVAPQITVNVQAMDARSFLDRSSDIAAAVREAMLNLNSINDVVNDL